MWCTLSRILIISVFSFTPLTRFTFIQFLSDFSLIANCILELDSLKTIPIAIEFEDFLAKISHSLRFFYNRLNQKYKICWSFTMYLLTESQSSTILIIPLLFTSPKACLSELGQSLRYHRQFEYNKLSSWAQAWTRSDHDFVLKAQ